MGKSLDFSGQFSWSSKDSREQPNTVNPFSKSEMISSCDKWAHAIKGIEWLAQDHRLDCRVWCPLCCTTAVSEQPCSGDLRWITSFEYLRFLPKGKGIFYLSLYFAVSLRAWQNKKKKSYYFMMFGIEWKISCISRVTWFLVKKAGCRRRGNMMPLRKSFKN